MSNSSLRHVKRIFDLNIDFDRYDAFERHPKLFKSAEYERSTRNGNDLRAVNYLLIGRAGNARQADRHAYEQVQSYGPVLLK